MAIEAAALRVTVDSDTSQAESGLGRLSGLISKVGSTPFAVLGNLAEFTTRAGLAVFGVGQLAQGVEGLAGSLFGFNANIEQATVAFTGLLGSGDAATAMLGDLQKFAAATPFEFPDLVTASQRLLGVGIAAQDVIPWMTAIGDAVAGMGGNAQSVDRVTTAITQMSAKGKITGEEMMQLTEANIPGWQLLSKATGKTTAELMDMSQKGLLPASEYLPLLISGMEGTFGGQMANQAKTFNGLMSSLKDNIRLALGAFMGPLFDQAKGALDSLGKAVQSPAFQEFAENMGKRVGAAVATAAAAFMSLLPTLETIGKFLIGAFTYGWTLARDAVLTFVAALQGNWADDSQIRPLHRAIGEFGLLIRNQVIPAVTAMADFFVNTALPALITFGSWFMATGLPAIQGFASSVAAFVTGTIIPAIQQFATAALPILQQFGQWFITVGLPAIQNFATQAAAFITGTLIPGFTSVASIIFPILLTLAQFIGQHIALFLQIAAVVGGAIAVFSAIIGPITGIVGAVSAVVAVVGPMVAAFVAAGGGMTGMGAAAAILIAAIGPVVLIVAGIAAAVALLAVAWSQNWGDIQGKTDAVIKALTPVFDTIVDILSVVVPAALTSLGGYWQIFASVVSGVVDIIKALLEGDFAGAWDAAKTMVSGVIDGIGTVLSGLPAMVAGYFLDMAKQALDALGRFVTDAGAKAGEVLSGIIAAIASLPGDVAGIVADMAGQAVSLLGTLVTDATGAAASVLSGILGAIQSMPGDVGGIVGDAASSALDKLGGLVTDAGVAAANLLSAILNAVTSLPHDLSTIIGNAIDAFMDVLNGAIDRAGEAMGHTKDAIINVISGVDLSEIGKQIVQGLIDGITDMLGPLGDAVGKIGGALSHVDVPGFSPPDEAGFEIGQMFVGRMADGITFGVPLLQRAVEHVGRVLAVHIEKQAGQVVRAAVDVTTQAVNAAHGVAVRMTDGLPPIEIPIQYMPLPMPILPGVGAEPVIPQYLTGNGNYGTTSGPGGTHGARTGPAKGGGYWYDGVLYASAAAAHAANNIDFGMGQAGGGTPNTTGAPTVNVNVSLDSIPIAAAVNVRNQRAVGVPLVRR